MPPRADFLVSFNALIAPATFISALFFNSVACSLVYRFFFFYFILRTECRSRWCL